MLINMILFALWLIPMMICMDDLDNLDAPYRQVEAMIISVIPFVNLIAASVIMYNRITGRK